MGMLERFAAGLTAFVFGLCGTLGASAAARTARLWTMA